MAHHHNGYAPWHGRDRSSLVALLRRAGLDHGNHRQNEKAVQRCNPALRAGLILEQMRREGQHPVGTPAWRTCEVGWAEDMKSGPSSFASDARDAWQIEKLLIRFLLSVI
jgi:hypothetical protein